MKLIYCKWCGDLVKLNLEIRYCRCKKSSGKYTNDLDAIYAGKYVVPLGINNFSFKDALNNQPKEGLGEEFQAFVIPSKCPTFKKKSKI